MKPDKDLTAIIKKQGLLPLYFHRERDTSERILFALYSSGVRVVEYTNRGDEALNNFRHLVNMRDEQMPGLLLAAGTIKTKQNAIDYIEAGADFIISPGLNVSVAQVANQHNIFWVPGCMTPSEIMQAEELGATLIKIFPGSLLGPGFVSAIRELFPALSFIPTGGVTLDKENLLKWFRSGVIAVGAGSTLINKAAKSPQDFDEIQSAATSALHLVNEVRSSAL